MSTSVLFAFLRLSAKFEKFGVLSTECLTVSTLSGDLAFNFLPLVDGCSLFEDVINDPVSSNFFTQGLIWILWEQLLKLKLLRYFACTDLKEFVSR